MGRRGDGYGKPVEWLKVKCDGTTESNGNFLVGGGWLCDCDQEPYVYGLGLFGHWHSWSCVLTDSID